MNEHFTSAQLRELQRPVKKPRARPEYDLHCAVVEYIHSVWPTNLAHHAANGEIRSKATAAKLKRMGVRRGVPDLCVPYGGGRTLWLEIKASRGRASAQQEAFIQRLRDFDHKVAIIRSVEDVKNAFKALGIITKE